MSILTYNKCLDPHTLKKRDTWGLTAQQNTDGTWSYQNTLPAWRSVFPFNFDGMAGDTAHGRVGFVRFTYSGSNPPTAMEYQVQRLMYEQAGNYFLIACLLADRGNHTLAVQPTDCIQLHEVGLYEPDDWPRVKAYYDEHKLALPWFAGDTLPSGGGLSFVAAYPHLLLEVCA